MPDAQKLLSSNQVARRLDITPERVRQLARAGRLQPTIESSLGRLFSESNVIDFAAARARRQTLPKAA